MRLKRFATLFAVAVLASLLAAGLSYAEPIQMGWLPAMAAASAPSSTQTVVASKLRAPVKLVFTQQEDFDEDGIGDACDPQTGPPARKEQCKDERWRRFDSPRAFKNQGDCIQYLSTGK